MDKLCSKSGFQQQKSFLYAAYREQFIELIEAQEYQKAFTHLTKRLKPLEAWAQAAGTSNRACIFSQNPELESQIWILIQNIKFSVRFSLQNGRALGPMGSLRNP